MAETFMRFIKRDNLNTREDILSSLSHLKRYSDNMSTQSMKSKRLMRSHEYDDGTRNVSG